MKAEDVLAVVVSYNGLEKTRQAVDALRGQVGHVHIVDNGSDRPSLDVLESMEQENGITVDRVGENRGVGYALNLGVKRAREWRYDWLLTMDQDSVVDRGLIQAYAAAVEEEPRRVCLAPRTIARDGRPARKSGATRYAITSGNLVAVGLFDQTGLYDEGFFIDCIDFDFSLRVRRAGVGVYRVAGALMQHEVGGDVRVPRLARIFYARHPAVRRYYMYRNFMYLAERYLLDFPVFIVKLGILQLVLLPFIGAFDTHPLRSYRAVAQGIWDYAARRTGAYEERLK